MRFVLFFACLSTSLASQQSVTSATQLDPTIFLDEGKQSLTSATPVDPTIDLDEGNGPVPVEAPVADPEPHVFHQTKERWLKILRNALRETYDADMLPPYVGEGPRRLDVCPGGVLNLQGRIAQTYSSVIFNAIVTPKQPDVIGDTPLKRRKASMSKTVAVKYYNDCFERKHNQTPDVHPLIHEFSIMRVLSGLHIAPEAFYVSPAATLTLETSTDVSGPLPSLELANRVKSQSIEKTTVTTCVALNTQVRFMVMEEVGIDVSSYMRWLSEQPVANYHKKTLKLSIKMIDLLQRLHRQGFCHGDIHHGNVAFKHNYNNERAINLDTAELVLIDFAMSDFYLSKIGTTVHQERRRDLGIPFLSPWHINNERLSPRDDLFRAFELISSWVTRGEVKKHLDKTISDLAQVTRTGSDFSRRAESYIIAKKKIRYFSRELVVRGLPAGEPVPVGLDVMVLHLDLAFAHIRNLDDPDMEPDYFLLRAQLNNALAALG